MPPVLESNGRAASAGDALRLGAWRRQGPLASVAADRPVGCCQGPHDPYAQLEGAASKGARGEHFPASLSFVEAVDESPILEVVDHAVELRRVRDPSTALEFRSGERATKSLFQYSAGPFILLKE